MQVVTRRGSSLVCEEAPEPVPGPGQTLVKSLACGICGSDLHSLHYGAKASLKARGGGPEDAPRQFVFGHEFCAEVLDHGPGGASRLRPGARVVSMPFARGPAGTETIGYSTRFPGGFAERMVLTSSLMLEVPNGLPADVAALTEPLAVGAHGVGRATLDKDSVVLIVGMGPVGAAVLMNLKALSFGPIIAADFSPRRRQLAEQLGADVVIDPASESPHDRWESFGVSKAGPDPLAPLLASHGAKRAVIFECVGNPGVLQSIIAGAPFGSEVVVLGVCMEPDTFQPAQAVGKELSIRTGVFYSAEEFARSLHNLAEGIIDGRPLITDHVGLSGVADAFERLKNPEEQVKIIVEAGRA
jgi:threonine dehydrogenase-like Zn-dependent dehydrogenase